MIQTPISAAAIALSVFAGLPAAAQTAPTDALFDALLLPEIIEVMVEEGHSYGAQIGADLFPDKVTPAWDETVVAIYDGAKMERNIRDDFAKALDGQDIAPMMAFFATDLGQVIVTHEASARRALLDESLADATEDAAKIARTDRTDRFAVLERYAVVNNLIDENVIGAMNSNVAFYSGLMAGGAFNGALTPDLILEDVWDQEPDIRNSTTDWIYGFLLLAYDPLSDGEIESYSDFFETEAGQALNGALFDAFEDTFDGISYQLGFEAAQVMSTTNL